MGTGKEWRTENKALKNRQKIRYSVGGRTKSGKAVRNAIAFRLELVRWCASKNRGVKERTPSLKECIFYGTLRPPFSI